MKRGSVLLAGMAAIALLPGFTACSGGSAGFIGTRPFLHPIDIDIKQLRFSWPAFAEVDFYRLFENPDGIAGFHQIGPDLMTNQYTHEIAVHLQDWPHASYLLQGCTMANVCTDSLPRSATDSIAAIGYLKAANTGTGDRFGHAVALSADGTVVALGAPDEDGELDLTPDSGAVYLYVRQEGAWQPPHYLKAGNAEPGDGFGYAVALSGDGGTLAIGAWKAKNGTNNETGAVYLFEHDGQGNWLEQTILQTADAEHGDRFGQAVALSHDGLTLVVGAPGDNSMGADAGAVYTFTRNALGWSPPSLLKAGTPEAGAAFGQSVAINGDGTVLATGAPRESDDGQIGQGAVYVFAYTTQWDEITRLTPDDGATGDRFGTAVALAEDGATLAVGAPLANNGLVINSGAAYVFIDQDDWTLEQRLQPDADFFASTDQFGISVTLGGADGDLLAVGAHHENGAASGVGGDPLARFAPDAGAGYLFRRDGLAGTWLQHAYLKASHTQPGDQFGFALAMSEDGRTLAIGAPHESSAATGIGGDPSDQSAPDAGAAYLY